MKLFQPEGCEPRQYVGSSSIERQMRCYGGGPSVPDPAAASVAGIQQTEANYPFSYIINALQQTGGKATLTNPATGQPQTYDFTGAGQADVQNQVSNQMAQVLLDIQQGYGAAYIQQRLNDLKQADPNGYAAYGQLFDQIQNDISQTPPDQPLSQATQSSVLSVLKNSDSLTPEELTQVQQASRANNIASGVYLGNAPAQAEATNTVNALDQKNAAAQGEAGKYLASGVTPSDIQYRNIQQNLADLGAFINGQTPTAQFSSLSGAQTGAAPVNNTGYQVPTLNEGQAAGQGINQANQLYSLNQQNANPYLAGLNFATQGIGTAYNAYNAYNAGSNSPYNLGAAINYDPGFGAGTGYGTTPTGEAATAADYASGGVAG